MRSGKAYHATPIGRVAVHHNPDANLITDLEKGRWLDNLRRTARAKEASSALQNAVHSLENQLFDLTRHPTASVIQRLIIGIGNIGRTQAVSGKLRENLSFLPEMDSRWLEKAQSSDAAFRIATALSSIGGGKAPMMRSHIYPLDGGSGWKLNKEGKNPLCTFSHADLTTELCRMAERRHLAARQDKIAFSLKGSSPVNEKVLAAFLADPDMDTRILALLPGLCLIKKHFPLKAADTEQNTHRPPLAYRLLKPFFCDHGDLVSAGILQEDIRLPLDAEIIRYLSTDQVERAVQTATRRLRIAGLQIPKHLPDCGGIHGKRLLAALMIPIYPATLKALTQTAFSAAETA
jgi:CRISPR-associated protein Csx17